MNVYRTFLVCSVVNVHRSWLLRTVDGGLQASPHAELTYFVHILLG